MEYDIKVMNHLDHCCEYYQTDTLDKAKSFSARKATDKRVLIFIRDDSGLILTHRIKGKWIIGEPK